MSEQNVVPDNNPTDPVSGVGKGMTPAELAAQAQAGRAKLEAAIAAERSGTVANTPVTENPAPAAEADKALEVPAQFKDKDGNLDVEKLEKSKQHLELSLEQKRKILEDYKNTQREFTQVSGEVAKTEKKPAPAVPNMDELKKQYLADLEKDPAEALVKATLLGQQMALQEIDRREAEKAQAAKQEGWLGKLDDYAKSHPWVYSPEGQEAIKDVLRTRPYLYKGEDPYGDALAFVDKTKFQAGQQPGAPNATPNANAPRMPILSGNRAVPPPVPQAASNEAKLKELSNAMLSASSDKERQALAKQMDEIVARSLGVRPPSRF